MTYMLNMHSPRMHQEWGMTERLNSIKTAIRYLREGRGRSASVRLNKRVVWQRSSVRAPKHVIIKLKVGAGR